MAESELNDACTIGELASAAGVSTRTIRYYEELGILPPPPRSVLGTRLYPQRWRFYLDGALALKGLGFSLQEIALVGHLAIGDISPDKREEALGLVAENMKALEHRIRVLKAIQKQFKQRQAVAGGIAAVVENTTLDS